MEKSLINPLKEAQKEYQELIGKYGKLCTVNSALQFYIEELKEENEQLKKDNTELCERLEAVAKESGKALTRQIIAESIVADLPKENGIVWHDLRKNPDDLPTPGNTGISDYVITDRGAGYYNGRVKSWWVTDDYALTDKVIAWCEIPKFEDR